MKNTKTIAPIVDIMTSTIYVTKSYYKAACTYGTKEYKDFREMLKDNEGFKIEFSGSDKKTYSKLTFEAMRAYIETQANSKEMLAKFEAACKVAKAKKASYPAIKKWFFENYPEYKVSGVSDDEIESLVNAAEAEQIESKSNVIEISKAS